MTTAVDVRAPAEQTEGTRSQVLRWLKNVGDPVAENEPLIEIETDKVTVEVASPGAGILREIVKGEQEEIAPGEVLGRIEAADAGAGRAVGVAPSGAAAAGTATAGAVADGIAVGVAPSGAAADGVAVGSSARGAQLTGGGLATGAGAGDGAGQPRGSEATATPGVAANRLSPAVRRLLSENNLDPTAIHGTGQGGRITVEDVLATIAAGRSTNYVANAAAAGAGVAAGTPATPAGGRSIPHTAVRKRIAEHMVRSLLHTAPHVTTVFEADMTAVLAHRQKHRDEFAKRGAPLTLTAYFLQAIVDAIRAVPEANSRWTDSALEVFDSIHIGVGTAIEEGGLVVPVLRDVQTRDLFATAEGLNDLVTRAREGRLTPADVRGGTFTISNHGVSGSLVATPIVINQPQSAILGVGKLEKRVVVLDEGGEERIAIRPRCYVTLTIDHRVMDGHQANRFLHTFVSRLTNWP
jgi:2-oxoglutarate dehydrogenase E2 component (dihydrolipoamide succinyltransferase)